MAIASDRLRCRVPSRYMFDSVIPVTDYPHRISLSRVEIPAVILWGDGDKVALCSQVRLVCEA